MQHVFSRSGYDLDFWQDCERDLLGQIILDLTRLEKRNTMLANKNVVPFLSQKLSKCMSGCVKEIGWTWQNAKKSLK